MRPGLATAMARPGTTQGGWSAACRPRPRPGDHGLDRARVRTRRRRAGARLRRADAALPPPGLGRARPGGDLGHHPGGGRARARRRRRRAWGAGRDRHHQPARDHDSLGPRLRRARLPRDRLAEPADLRAVRPAQGGRPRAADPRAHRFGRRRLLLRHQDSLDSRHRAGCQSASRARRARVRHRRFLAAVAPDRRPGARHRPHQRVAHAAVRRSPPPLGRRFAARSRGPGQPAARGAPLRRRLRPHRRARRRARRRADRRHRRRPAGGAVRPGVLAAGDGEEHLRHRVLRHDEHRRRRPRPAPAGCSPPRRATPGAGSPTPSRGPSSSPARRCSGCATSCG